LHQLRTLLTQQHNYRCYMHCSIAIVVSMVGQELRLLVCLIMKHYASSYSIVNSEMAMTAMLGHKPILMIPNTGGFPHKHDTFVISR